MTNSIPAPGEFYRHFKDKCYQILAIATHSETKEKLVIYQALYDDFGVYARPLSMFISEVDHEKYPDVKQKFRFEKIDPAILKAPVKENVLEKVILGKREEAPTKEEQVKKIYPSGENLPNPILMEFLDIRSMNDKCKFLADNKKKLTDDMINAMAASIDVTVPDGPIELRYSSLRTCLQTKAKYEITRLR